MDLDFLKEFLKCIVCHERSDSMKTIPCMHHICVECLDNLSDSGNANGKLNCVVCGCPFTLSFMESNQRVNKFLMSLTVAVNMKMTETPDTPCAVCERRDKESNLRPARAHHEEGRSIPVVTRSGLSVAHVEDSPDGSTEVSSDVIESGSPPKPLNACELLDHQPGEDVSLETSECRCSAMSPSEETQDHVVISMMHDPQSESIEVECLSGMASLSAEESDSKTMEANVEAADLKCVAQPDTKPDGSRVDSQAIETLLDALGFACLPIESRKEVHGDDSLKGNKLEPVQACQPGGRFLDASSRTLGCDDWRTVSRKGRNRGGQSKKAFPELPQSENLSVEAPARTFGSERQSIDALSNTSQSECVPQLPLDAIKLKSQKTGSLPNTPQKGRLPQKSSLNVIKLESHKNESLPKKKRKNRTSTKTLPPNVIKLEYQSIEAQSDAFEIRMSISATPNRCVTINRPSYVCIS